MNPADQNQKHRSNHHYRRRPSQQIDRGSILQLRLVSAHIPKLARPFQETPFSDSSLFRACRRISDLVDLPACHARRPCRGLGASPLRGLSACQSHLDQLANSFGAGGRLVACRPAVNQSCELHRQADCRNRVLPGGGASPLFSLYANWRFHNLFVLRKSKTSKAVGAAAASMSAPWMVSHSPPLPWPGAAPLAVRFSRRWHPLLHIPASPLRFAETAPPS